MRVDDVLECISKIQSYTDGLDLDQFRNDSLRIDAVIRNLEIQEKYPHLAWFEMRGMRNIMAHEYFGVSIPIIWETIQNDLGPLAEGMRQILKEQD